MSTLNDMNQFEVVALPGGYLKGRHLQEDMGNPDWVHRYLDGHTAKEVLPKIPLDKPLVLVGYSIGGSVIGDLSTMGFDIVGAVLYESPLLDVDYPGGNFPVLWIENKVERWAKGEIEFHLALQAWELTRPGKVTKLYGGFDAHWKWKRRWPPIAHAWDRRLNVFIKGWIEGLVNEP